MKNILSYVMVPIVLCTIGLGCAKEDKNVIRIGAAGPMTGDQSKMGMDLKNSVQLAVDEWNERGGVLGKKIVLLSGDDAADPKQAVSVANKFINRGVVGVIGHWNSSCSIPASTNYHNAGVVMITPATTNPKLTRQKFKNVFRVCGTDDQQGRIAADFVSRKLKPERIAIIHDKTAYGQGLADYFKRALSKKIDVVYYGGIIIRDPDYKAVLTAIKNTKPDLYFFGGIYPEAGRLVRQARELGMTIPMITGDGVYDPTFINIAGTAADGTFITFGRDPSRIPSAQSFIETYRARYGDLGPYSIYAYDAANILLRAIKETRSVNGSQLAAYISATPFKGALGTISFDQRGDVTKAPYVIWQVKDGTFVQIQ